MNLVLAIPLPWRLVGLFVLGALLGGMLNLAIYRLAWFPRMISPWSLPGPWTHKLPLVGWWLRRGEAGLTRAFWLRPLLVELLTATLFAVLYWWYVDQQALVGPLQWVRLPPIDHWASPGGIPGAVHACFGSHLILISLMIVASFIDIDERIIPDAVTVPGTLAGLLLAAVLPWSLLPDGQSAGLGVRLPVIDLVTLASPNRFPASLGGWPHWGGLLLGCACFLGWCFALLPRRWNTRRGVAMAWRLFVARLTREPVTLLIAGLAVVGTLLITLTWWIGGIYWVALLSALVGMAASGGTIWLVRILASLALGKEAMGFGDVTLMGMIGAFLGWQAGLLVFFVAPFVALAIGLGYVVLRRDPEIPYGPFLCLAALTVMIRWSSFWEWARPLFALGPWILVVFSVCLVALVIMLGGLRLVRSLLTK